MGRVLAGLTSYTTFASLIMALHLYFISASQTAALLDELERSVGPSPRTSH